MTTRLLYFFSYAMFFLTACEEEVSRTPFISFELAQSAKSFTAIDTILYTCDPFFKEVHTNVEFMDGQARSYIQIRKYEDPAGGLFSCDLDLADHGSYTIVFSEPYDSEKLVDYFFNTNTGDLTIDTEIISDESVQIRGSFTGFMVMMTPYNPHGHNPEPHPADTLELKHGKFLMEIRN